jgi:hypothetical protein
VAYNGPVFRVELRNGRTYVGTIRLAYADAVYDPVATIGDLQYLLNAGGQAEFFQVIDPTGYGVLFARREVAVVEPTPPEQPGAPTAAV